MVAVNDIEGKINYGNFSLKLFEGPIYVEELDPHKQKPMDLRVSFQSDTEAVEP